VEAEAGDFTCFLLGGLLALLVQTDAFGASLLSSIGAAVAAEAGGGQFTCFTAQFTGFARQFTGLY